jgi:dynein heavy chain 2
MWLRQLVGRTVALDSWKQRSESGKILSSTLNLSDLFRPDTFLNALRQQTARASKKAIDTLRLVVTWDSNYVSFAQLLMGGG